MTYKCPYEAKTSCAQAVKVHTGVYEPVPEERYSRELRSMGAWLLTLDRADRPSIREILESEVMTRKMHDYEYHVRLVSGHSLGQKFDHLVENLSRQVTVETDTRIKVQSALRL